MLSVTLGLSLVVLLGLLYCYVFWHYKPKKLCQEYADTLTKLGYKVCKLPFSTFRVPIYDFFDKGFEQNKDPLYDFKYTLQGYDVLVGNVQNRPHVCFLNLKLGAEVNMVDKFMKLPKARLLFNLLMNQLGKSVFFYEGDQWRIHRNNITKIFTFEYLKQQTPYIVEVCDKVYDKMEEKNQENGSKGTLESHIFKLGLRTFSAVSISSFMGIDSLKEYIQGQPINQFALYTGISSFMGSFDPIVVMFGQLAYKLKFRKHFSKMRRRFTVCKDYARKKLYELKYEFANMTPEQQQTSKNVIINFLWQAKNEKTGHFFSDDDIIEEMMNFFFAGSETTSAMFTSMMLLTFENPDVENYIRKKIGEHFKKNEDFTYENLKQMEYIDWIQLEAIRMRVPSVGLFDRLANEDVMITDIPIKKGTIVNYFQITNLYDEKLFPEPTKFKPERWAEKNEHTQQMLNLVLMTFGSGPRFCLGKNLAMMETKIAFIKFLQRYKNLKMVDENVYQLDTSYHPINSTCTFQRNI